MTEYTLDQICAAIAKPLGESPWVMDVTDMLNLESLSPVQGYDEIYSNYSTTFGRVPDALMGKVVEETKQRLLLWLGAHRETIREALVAYETDPKRVGPK